MQTDALPRMLNICWLHYVVEAKQVRDDSQIAMCQTQGLIFQGQKVTAGVLKNAKNLRTMIRTDAAIKFLKNVQGVPATGDLYRDMIEVNRHHNFFEEFIY